MILINFFRLRGACLVLSVLYNSRCLFEDDKGYIYSCDNVRLKGYISEDEQCQKDFHNYFDDQTRIDISDVCTRTSLGQFRYLWSITCLHTTITVLHWFNGYDNSNDNKRMVVIEFNPNKLVYDDFLQINSIISNLKLLEIVRCDIAIDISAPRDIVHLIKDSRTYEFQDHNKNGVTEYLGTRNNTNYVKLYDKMRESNLDSPLTRLEITCRPFISEFKNVVPQVIIEADQITLESMQYSELNSTQIQFVSALKEIPLSARDRVLKKLNYRIRNKLRPYVLADTYSLIIDYKCVQNIFWWLNDCVHYKTFLFNGQ